MPRLASASILVVVPMAGVGDDHGRRLGDAGAGQLALGRADHRFKVAEIRRVGVELGGEDDLALVADGLGVVALHVAARRLDVAQSGSLTLALPAGDAGGS